MDERLARIISNIATFEDLAQFEKNAQRQGALDAEVEQAIKSRSAALGRKLITERTGIEFSELTSAEEKIFEAVSEYVGVMKRQCKDATRTFIQLRDRGLTEAAEAAVAKLKPTEVRVLVPEQPQHPLQFFLRRPPRDRRPMRRSTSPSSPSAS